MPNPLQPIVHRWFPNRIVLPILLAFAFENLLSALLSTFVSPKEQVYVWAILFIIALVYVAHEVDEQLQNEEQQQRKRDSEG